MADVPQSIISHVSIGTNDFDAAVQFYDAVLGALGCRRVMDYPGAAAYGRDFPEFWVQNPTDGGKANPANGFHASFRASSRAEVDAFYAAAIKAGGTDEGPPGLRPEYTADYYGAFVRDLDGHKIEANYFG